MSSLTAIEKCYVQPDNQVPITCPECGYTKLISLDGVRHPTQPVRLQCKCGNTFKRVLEFRKHHRKPIDLQGVCYFEPFEKRIATVKLLDLSMGGVCLKVRNADSYQQNSRGQLNFTLDNHKNSVISKKLVIRSRSNEQLHCQFVQDQAYDKDLGFYLRW